MSVVYVLSPERRPLMPCSAAIARLLLKEKKAKVVRRTPFTIKLMAPPETTYTQPITLGVDTGSSVVGAAAADEKGNILYLSEVELRNDIASKSITSFFAVNREVMRKTIC
jgi:RRXRR protein